VDIPTLAQATDIHLPDMESRLDGTSDLTLSELVRVGGFLRLRPDNLLKGAGA
jgi:hypothetical protein